LNFYRRKQPDDWQRFRSESLLGVGLARQEKYDDIEARIVAERTAPDSNR
jgi:hypothetical protein